MSDHDAVLREFLLHILADDSGLDAGDHVVLVHPLNFVHSGDVHRNYAPLLIRLAHQGFSNVSSTAEGNEHNVVLFGRLYQLLSLLVGSYVNHVVDSSRQFGVSQQKELLQGVSVRVENSGHFVSIDLINFALNLFHKGRVFDDGVDGDLSLWF